MLRKFFQLFTGEKKYFSLVILIIIVLFLSAIIFPPLIDRIKKNWNEDLPYLLVKIENSSLGIFKSEESDLITKSTHLKNYIRENLEPRNFSYRSLVKLVNDKEFENLSAEVIAPNGRLIAWNKKIAIPPENVFPLSNPLGEDFFYIGDLNTFLCIIDTLHIENDNFYTVLSIPVEKHYTLQNQYYINTSLIKEFSDKFLTEFKIDYTPFAEGVKDGRYFSFALLNIKNHKIGEATIAKPIPDVTIKNIRDELSMFQSMLVFIGLIFLTLGFRVDYRKIKYNSIRLIIIIIYAVLIRLLFYMINFPSNVLGGPINNPAYFSSAFAGGIVKSPIDFLITSLLFFWICFEIFKYIFHYIKSKKESGIHINLIFILLCIFITLLLVTIRGLSASIKSIIFDSSLRYFKEPNLIPDSPSLILNLILLILGTSVVVIMLGYFLLFVSFAPKENKNRKNFLYLFLLTQLCVLLYLFIQTEPLVTPFLSFLIISLVFILGYYVQYKRLNFIYIILFSAVVGSLISISLLIHFNQSLEKESLKTTALELNRPNNNLLRFMITETLLNSSKKNEVIEALQKKKSNYYALAFKLWSGSALQKESDRKSVV